MAVNPKIQRDLAKLECLTAYSVPVDSSNTKIPDLRKGKHLQIWKHLPNSKTIRVERKDNHGKSFFYSYAFSIKFRWIVRALLKEIDKNPNLEAIAVTCNLGSTKTLRIAGSKRGPVSFLGEKISRFIRGKKQTPRILMIAEEENNAIHTHSLIVIEKELVSVFEDWLKKQYPQRRAVHIARTYRLRSKPLPDSTEADIRSIEMEIDVDSEDGEELYVYRDGDGHVDYVEVPIDAGWADYAAKNFSKKSKFLDGHKRYFVSADIRAQAELSYTAAYEYWRSLLRMK